MIQFLKQASGLLMKASKFYKIFKSFLEKTSKEIILVFRSPSQIGDNIVSIPAFKAIKEKHPLAQIILLTYSPKKNILIQMIY